jgi:hypothetical protein
MRLEYICSQCGSAIDHLEVQKLDEIAFGFDKLNESERQELLSFDPVQNTLTVKSLCDQCIEDMKVEPYKSIPTTRWVH